MEMGMGCQGGAGMGGYGVSRSGGRMSYRQVPEGKRLEGGGLAC